MAMETVNKAPASLVKRIVSTILALAILVWVGLFVFGFIRAIWEDQKEYPGKPQFVAANEQITTYEGNAAFGNSDEGKKLAAQFSPRVKLLRQTFFTPGSKVKLSLSQGEFITFCQTTPEAVVFLCHVPEFRKYGDDAKTDMAKLAWMTAQEVVKQSGRPESTRLVVALRGFASYGAVWEGTLVGDAKAKVGDTEGRKLLYQFFAVGGL